MSQSKFANVLFCILIGLEVTKVEICALRHVAVELEPGKVIRVCVRPRFSRVTALRILPKLRQKLRGDEWGTVARPFFL